MTLQRILVVDDESLAREYLGEAVTSLGYSAVSANEAEAALTMIEREQPDVVLTDLRMPGMDGVQLTQRIQERWPDLPVVLCTGFSEWRTQDQIEAIGIDGLLLKPIVKSHLAKTIRQLLDAEKSATLSPHAVQGK